MVNKKVSGQTVTIIILAVLLLIAIAFGGVYAYYSAKSNKMTGTVVMANLNIELMSNEYGTNSAKSEIVISHGNNFVPGQELKNSSLKIVNKSRAPIYLVVVYEIKATKLNEAGELISGDMVDDSMKNPLIDFGTQYINPQENIYYSSTTNNKWIDYVFTYIDGDEVKQYRCLVSTTAYDKKENDPPQEIEVIGENSLKIHRLMNDNYQRTSLAFAFQAYAIGANSFSFDSNTSQADKCEQIISAIYESVEYKFFEGTVNVQ